jgi:hypothetical protein
MAIRPQTSSTKKKIMVEVGKAVISFDVLTKPFVCDLNTCKGICCIEGDAGAPVTETEIEKLKEILPIVWDDLEPQAREVIDRQGVSYKDIEGDDVTSIVDGKECVFTYRDTDGTCKCAIEKAYREGRTDFYKPISCHLYPIRLTQSGEYTMVNYHRWEVCKCACKLGKKLDIPVYKFLKEPLIRRFGAEWYKELETVVKELKKQNYI